MSFGGLMLTALAGALGWIALSFIGTPIRRFWDLRGEVSHALHEYSRYIPGSPLYSENIAADSGTPRFNAGTTLHQLGLKLIAFWENEYLARVLLRACRIDAAKAGAALVELGTAISKHRVITSPRHEDIVASLHL
jgi:hypothetical protein